MKRSQMLRAVVAALATMAALPVASGPAHAQGQSLGNGVYACSDGTVQPGPCHPGQNDVEAASQPPPPPLPDIFMAVATHPDVTAIWATSGYPSNEGAKQAALDGCAKAMGEGCTIAATWSNDAEIAVVRDAAGYLFVEGAAARRGKAEAAALRECQKISTGCQSLKSFFNTESPRNDFSSSPIRRRPFTAVAWPKGDAGPKWRNTAWLVSGQQGYAAAERAALQRCRADSGVECMVGQTVGGGLMVRYVDDDEGKSYWLGAGGPDVVGKRVQTAGCGAKRQCRLVETFDAQTPRALTIDLTRAETPSRGFFSMAWTSEVTPWKGLAVVTGRQSRAEAKAAAVALCEQESKARCEPFSDEDDRGIAQYVIVLRDSANNVRTHFGFSPASIIQRKEESCARSGVTCPKGQVIDLAKPASFTLMP